MKIPRRLLIILLVLAPALIFAGEMASVSTTQPTPISADSPRAALKAAADGLPAGGITFALKAYHVTSDKERDAARAMAAVDLASARLEKLTRDRFGSAAGDRIVRAMRLATDGDLSRATEEITGDHAVVTLPDNRDPLDMIKVDGAWKIDVAKLIEGEDKPQEFNQSNNNVAKAIDEVTHLLQSGQYPNDYLLERAVRQRMYRVLGDEDDND